ncbi:hypothetical protein CMUS01_15092 [Colletotrichum musicola]|uniref:F-box domain-containing protein n=1 Tax=Colletotrichum musicola TaxID=2175873 RepID=A0A8H6MPE6_9PEZI|nr:hypothetical protein CMUS01_15092 [Colletotrichum musicola]
MANEAHQVSFEDLPSEIVLQIFSSISDLPTLDHLTIVSPNAFRVFHTYGPEIIHQVANKSVIRETLVLMRCVAFIRRSMPADKIEKTFEKFLRVHVMARGQLYESWPMRQCGMPRDFPTGRWSFRNLLRGGLDKECPAHAFSAREFLVTARRTAIRAEKCLARARAQYLDRVPACPAEKICYGMMPWNDRFEGVRFAPPDGEPFTWVEMQRMWRGFWRLQLLEEIRTAEAAGRLGWRPSKDPLVPRKSFEKQYFDWMTTRDIDWGGTIHELHMAEEFVKETTGAGAAGTSDEVTAPGMRGNGMLWPAKTERTKEMKSNPVWWIRHLKNHAPGWKVAYRLTAAPGSPLRFIPMSEFRKLGVFVWDFERLKDMGLLWYTPWKPSEFPVAGGDASTIVFTWRSYLDEAVLRAADSRAKEEWEAYHDDMRSRHGFHSEEFYVVGSDWMRFVRQRMYGLYEMDWIEKARVAVAAA